MPRRMPQSVTYVPGPSVTHVPGLGVTHVPGLGVTHVPGLYNSTGLKSVTLPVSSVHPYGDPSTLGFNKRICSRLTPLTIPESRTP